MHDVNALLNFKSPMWNLHLLIIDPSWQMPAEISVRPSQLLALRYMFDTAHDNTNISP